MTFSRGYAFHHCCSGNLIEILEPRLGGDFSYMMSSRIKVIQNGNELGAPGDEYNKAPRRDRDER